MPQSVNPVGPTQLQWSQSVHKTLNGGVDMGVPIGKDSNGVYNQFNTGNSTGVLIRIGAAASSEPYKWTVANVGVSLNHALVDQNGTPRQPIGFKIVDKDKAMDVYRVGTPTTTNIILAPTDPTANVTVYVF